jgi:hypothetical protein
MLRNCFYLPMKSRFIASLFPTSKRITVYQPPFLYISPQSIYIFKSSLNPDRNVALFNLPLGAEK